MTVNDSFLASICANPEDLGLRLIYADWLEEHSDPLGEFIRVQIEQARLRTKLNDRYEDGELVHAHWSGPLHSECEVCNDIKDLEHREKELLSANEGRFLGGVNAILFKCIPFGRREYEPVFKRGFVEEISISCSDWLAHGPDIVKVAPTRSVKIFDKHPLWQPGLANCPFRWLRIEPNWPLQRPSEQVEKYTELPKVIFDLLQGHRPGHWHYDTALSAMDDLSRAAISWARSQAGLKNG